MKENDLVKEDENSGINTQKRLNFYKSQGAGFTRMEEDKLVIYLKKASCLSVAL